MRYLTAFLYLALLAYLPTASADQQANTPEITDYKVIAELSVTLVDGKKTTLGQLKGEKPLYVKFWASWCTSCLQQMQTLQNHFEQHGKAIEFVAINLGVEDTLDDVKAVQKRFNLTVPVAMDHDGQLASQLGFSGTPYHLLLNEHWQLVHKGHATDSALETAITSLVDSQVQLSQAPPIQKKAGQSPLGSSNLEKDHRVHLTPLPQDGVVFYTTVWCDWYMANERPSLAKRCAVQQQALTAFKQQNPTAQVAVWVAPAWTKQEDIIAYRTKYEIDYPLYVDYQDRLKRHFNIKHYAKTLVIEKGEIVHMIEDLRSEPLKPHLSLTM